MMTTASICFLMVCSGLFKNPSLFSSLVLQSREYFINWLSKIEAKYAGSMMYEIKDNPEFRNDQVLGKPMNEEYKKAIVKNYKENIDVLGITSRHAVRRRHLTVVYASWMMVALSRSFKYTPL